MPYVSIVPSHVPAPVDDDAGVSGSDDDISAQIAALMKMHAAKQAYVTFQLTVFPLSDAQE